MKGVSIKKAQPSNVIDIYDLLRKMHKEGLITYPKPTELQMKEFQFQLLKDLAKADEIYFLARRGRVSLGFISAQLVQRPFGTPFLVFIKNIYVTEKKRRLGIGGKLMRELLDYCQNMGIGVGEFLCDDSMKEYWEKKLKAKKVLNLMRIERNQ